MEAKGDSNIDQEALLKTEDDCLTSFRVISLYCFAVIFQTEAALGKTKLMLKERPDAVSTACIDIVLKQLCCKHSSFT